MKTEKLWEVVDLLGACTSIELTPERSTITFNGGSIVLEGDHYEIFIGGETASADSCGNLSGDIVSTICALRGIDLMQFLAARKDENANAEYFGMVTAFAINESDRITSLRATVHELSFVRADGVEIIFNDGGREIRYKGEIVEAFAAPYFLDDVRDNERTNVLENALAEDFDSAKADIDEF